METDAKQTLKGENGKEVQDSGYDIHFSIFSNTNGCVGVKSKDDMDKLLNLYEANKDTTDNRTLLIVKQGVENDK